MIDLIDMLPPMKSGNELMSELAVFPEYNESIRFESPATRLTALSNLYSLYIPSQMSLEIYSKLYLALLLSMQKKGTKIAIQQQYENRKAVKGQEYNGIIGGSDSFTIIGLSGIGKSAAIRRAITLITENRVIEIEKPYTKIVPFIVVQCPFDCSVKGLLLEVLRKVDEELDSKYYQNALRARATTDMLIGSVSQVALNHIGLLIVDEIQNVVNSKNGKSLIGSLTQLINNSGISICMVGIPESCKFFEQALQLARRSLGLQYHKLRYDDYFRYFCETVYSYQYVKKYTHISYAIIEWLYEHSDGIISIVISLIHDAQEIAILNGNEQLDLRSLDKAYQERITLLHNYIDPNIIHNRTSTKTPKKKTSNTIIDNNTNTVTTGEEDCSIATVVKYAKDYNKNIFLEVKKHFNVIEVKI